MAMQGRMPSNTGRDMEQSGQWAKVARKQYRHASGVMVTYNHNRWTWEVIDTTSTTLVAYDRLWLAREYVESKFVAVPEQEANR